MRWFELLAALTAAAGIVLAIRAWLRRPTRIEQPTLRVYDGESGRLLIPPAPLEISETRAAERREALLRRFGESAFESEAIDELPIGASTEFIESPPGVDLNVREFVTRTGPFAQLARINWQLQDRDLLLLERVSDLIIGIRRRQEAIDDGAVIRLSAEQDRPVVIIETDAPYLYESSLLRFGDWLGVGIRIDRSSRPRPQGRCTIGTGLDGTVGGILSTRDDTFGLTCAHVLSAECLSAHHRCSVLNESLEPDAALIRVGIPCFTFPTRSKHCTVASTADVTQMLRTHAEVSMRPPARGRGHGVAYTRVSFFSTGRVDYHFPHVEVRPSRSGIDKISVGYTTSSRFSKSGDSGSWVFEDGTERWIGLLVAGDSIERSSFVAESEPLLRYIRRVLRSRNVDLFSY